MHHPHVRHCEHRSPTTLWYRRFDIRPRPDRATCEPASVHRFGKERPRAIVGKRDDDIVGFRNGNPELVGFHGLDVLAIGLDHRHGQTVDPEVVVRQCRGIDDPKANTLAGLRNSGPVFIWGPPIHEEGVCRTGHIGNVRRIHPHALPAQARLENLGDALPRSLGLRLQVRKRGALKVEIALHRLELVHHHIRVHVRPV